VTPRHRTTASFTAVAAAAVLAFGCSGRSQPRPIASSSTRAPNPRIVRSTTSRPQTASPASGVGTAPLRPPWSVRQATLELYDATRMSPARGAIPAHRGRTLRTTLRWPVSAGGQVAPGRLPLVVFAHGYDVSGATYSVMLDALARAGIVVAAPEFPGESTAYPGPAVESDLVNEPCDMEFVGATLEHNPPAALRGVLPRAPFIVAGHSDGATAAAWAAYASTCSAVPIRAVVALSPDDVPMTAPFRFGRPPPLLAMTGTADEVNPLPHTLALYRHTPSPAWLVTVDGGSHLGTFTTDPDLARIDDMIADFVLMVADHDATAAARFARDAGGRVHVKSR
jgi:pimeloyl-ACP methyl ester carboxylesterase